MKKESQKNLQSRFLGLSKRSFDNHYRRCNFNLGKKGQVAVFVILAIVIVASIGLFFVLRGNIFGVRVPAELEPVYDYYLSCVENEAVNGAMILGQQGGYIETPEFSPGSEYMPFSSHLGFMGLGIPYWYYISGNGIIREQMPSVEKLESELENYVEGGMLFCDFAEFNERGFVVELDNEDIAVNVKIEENNIGVEVNQRLNIQFGEASWTGKSHSENVKSSLGKFYGLAKKIYLDNKETMFLENYGVDVLRLYAPVDGTEISCVPKVWGVDDVRIGLIDALEANVPAIKLEGEYYNLKSEENGYFVHDLGESVDTNVNFMYSGNWPMKMEVWPSDGSILRADPVGTQEGLGMMGFCYVPYHFVYDFAFPVLIQLYSGNEMFQFPVVVSIDKNNPREALDVEGLPNVVPELCRHKNSEMIVYTYNTNLDPVEAKIKFRCFDTSCDIGETESRGGDAILVEKFPQCVNGYIIASAEGYKTKKFLVSTVDEGSVDVILDKEYVLDLVVEGLGRSIVTFSKDDGSSTTVAYPDQKQIALSEGQYEVQVYVYGDSNLKLSGMSTPKCVEVSQSGFFGLFGATEEKCFNLDVPDQTVESAVSGGGTQKYYVSESELNGANRVVVVPENFGVPSKIEDLQLNYNHVQTSGLDVRFE